MGNISEILGKAVFPKPNGWDMEKEQFNLPYTVELKENIHIHWQDIRVEMDALDFDEFAVSIASAHKQWKSDGRKTESENMIRYGFWPGEEDYHFSKDRSKKLNAYGKPCHHYRVFPRTEMGKLYYDNVFQIELQKNGQFHIHYKNFRWELGIKQFCKVLLVMLKAFIKLNDLERA